MEKLTNLNHARLYHSYSFTMQSSKRGKIQQTATGNTSKREPPLLLYVGLSIHAITRNKGMVEKLEKLGLSVSYNRVVQVDKMLAHNVCEKFKSDGVVCPAALRRGLYTVRDIDNIDHNPTSTSADGSLHGTAISIMQFPTHASSGDTRKIMFQTENVTNEPTLPDSYTVVQAVSMKPSSTSVPPLKTADYTGYLKPAIAEMKEWVGKARNLLGQNISAEQTISWAGYHASRQLQLLNRPAIIALLPLFLEESRLTSNGKAWNEHS